MAEAIMETPKEWNIPGVGALRVGRPRVNWSIETVKLAWQKAKIYEKIGRGHPQEFDYKKKTHVRKLIEEARKEAF